MIADARQLRENGAQVFASRRQLDIQELLDDMVPGNLICHWRNVVHPIDNSYVLIEIEILAEFLEARMQVTDIGHRANHRFAIKGQNEAQRRVCGGMLWTKIQRVQEFLVHAGLVVDGLKLFQGHQPTSIYPSTFGPRDGREVVPFAASTKGVILSQSKIAEFVGH